MPSIEFSTGAVLLAKSQRPKISNVLQTRISKCASVSAVTSSQPVATCVRSTLQIVLKSLRTAALFSTSSCLCLHNPLQPVLACQDDSVDSTRPVLLSTESPVMVPSGTDILSLLFSF